MLEETLQEVRQRFEGLASWREFVAANPWTYERAYIEKVVASVRRNGVFSEFHGPTPAELVDIVGQNYRETLAANGCSSRVRAVIDEIALTVGNKAAARILALEAVTPFALALRGRYPYAMTVEYLPTASDRVRFFPIPHCDIMRSEFPDSAFDIVVSNDVLEHVPSLGDALRETCRILRPGGICLATFPFASGSEQTVVRAVLRAGAVHHLLPPEYHGNPVDPSGGSLVFATPAWDIVRACRAAGFQNAEMLFVSSAQRGITGSDCAGVHILRATA